MSDSFDVSRESSATSSLLHLLAPDDIPIIDAIVSRIPPDGTFPDAIKAYNEVMLARGLDKDNEVQYYRFMLKLSMLKGTWHDKWNTTKNGLDQHTTSAVQSSASFALSPLAKFATLRVTPLRADEYVEDDDVSLQAGTSTAVASRWNTPVPSRPTRQTASVPPPERADSKARLQSLLRQHSVPPPPPYVATAKGKERAVDQAPPAEPRVMDARTQFELEKCADAFREEVALRRAWDAWRAGFLWTKDTGQQVHRAYDQLLVHKTLQHWSLRRHQHQSRYTKATQSDQHRILKRCMILWVTKCQRKVHERLRKQEWQIDMRRRMGAVQIAHNQRLMAQCFVNWRMNHLSLIWQRHQSSQHARIALTVWRERFNRLAQLSNTAKGVIKSQETWLVSSALDHWRQLCRRFSLLRACEEEFRRWADRRLAQRTIYALEQRLDLARRADRFRLEKRGSLVLKRWKARLQHVRAQQARALRVSLRRDRLVVTICLRAWIAQERAIVLGRVRETRFVRFSVLTWVAKTRAQRLMEVHADEFAQRQAIPLATRALNCWKAKFQTRQRLILNVAAYHSAQLAKRTIAKWTLALRTILQAEQSAASLHQMLLTRRTIKQWKEAVTKRKLRAAWRVFKKKKQLEYLRRWRELTQMSRCARVLSNLISARGALRQWIKRIVEVKDRELLVGQDIDKRIMRGAFDRWRDKCKEHKHIESLLETSLLMQQQNLARAALDVWRSLLQRRRHLAFAEQTVVGNVMVLTAWSAWEAWRERFLERRLGVLERDFEFQMRTNLRVLVFSRWLAKTSTLPAIHFRVTHLKERSWDKWRDKMTPITEVRRARQVDQRRLMVRVFEKWQAVYKKKLSSKIAARMKWMHVPASRSSSQAPSSSRRPSFSGSALFTPAPRQTGMHLSRSPAPPFIHPPITPPLPLKRAAAAAPPSTTSEDSLDDERPRRPRSLVSAASSRGVARGRAAATLFSRPLSANGFRTGGGASTPSARTTVASDTPGPDGLWKHLRGGLMARGVGSSWADSRHTSPSA